MTRRAAALPTALALALGLAACGGASGDLMAIHVSGGAEAEPVEVVVAENGRGSCNRGVEETIPSELLIDARAIERELAELAEDGARYDATRAGQRRYVARMKAGTVRWAEGERGLPAVLPRAQLLALQLERELCR